MVEVTGCEKTNHSTIIRCINKVTNQLFGDIDFDMFALLITDGASYMVKGGKVLKEIYPSLLHVTCLAHGIQRLAEFVRANYDNEDKFIRLTKSKNIEDCVISRNVRD